MSPQTGLKGTVRLIERRRVENSRWTSVLSPKRSIRLQVYYVGKTRNQYLLLLNRGINKVN